MKRARFTDAQIVKILHEADRSPVAALAKRHGVSEPSIYAWRKKFGNMGAEDARRLKALEQGRYAIGRGVPKDGPLR
jgi:putative transposase